MGNNDSLKTLVEEITLHIKYAVPENEHHCAASLVIKYKRDKKILALLREYYTTLPEAREESVIRVATLMSLQSVFLLVLVTENRAYLYAASGEEIIFLGTYGNEVDEQILAHFGFNSLDAFLEKCLDVDELEDYEGHDPESSVCSACGVVEGENHLLGCTVEVCPWCEGQLSNCNCRFEQLGLEEIETESQLDEFYDLLLAKGPITFKREQNPSYPAAGIEPDKKGSK